MSKKRRLYVPYWNQPALIINFLIFLYNTSSSSNNQPDNMNLFSLIISACLCAATTVVADDKLKFYNVKSPMADIPNNKGTASFTVNSDGSVTIDIDREEAAQAIVNGNDCKFTMNT